MRAGRVAYALWIAAFGAVFTAAYVTSEHSDVTRQAYALGAVFSYSAAVATAISALLVRGRSRGDRGR